jgi:hypothetical protein
MLSAKRSLSLLRCFVLGVSVSVCSTPQRAIADACPAPQLDKKTTESNASQDAKPKPVSAQGTDKEKDPKKPPEQKRTEQKPADQKQTETKEEPVLFIENFWNNPANTFSRTGPDLTTTPLPTIQITLHVCEISKLKDGEFAATKLVPYINGTPSGDAHLDYVDRVNEQVRFSLPVTDKTRADWASLLRLSGTEVNLGLGWTATGEKVRATKKLCIRAASGWRLGVFLTMGLVLVITTFVLAVKTPLLRDQVPATVPPDPSPNPPKFTYSLARTQMAWWLVISAMSFLYVWAVLDTWSFNVKVLTLLGISGATGLSSVLIDSSKEKTAAKQLQRALTEQSIRIREISVAEATLVATATNERQKKLAEIAAQVEEERLRVIESNIRALARQTGPPGPTFNFLSDILDDKNGISLHRYQLVVWTIILGVMFVYRVITSLQMPTFDDTLLTLLGISGGLYLGFKWPDSKQ